MLLLKKVIVDFMIMELLIQAWFSGSIKQMRASCNLHSFLNFISLKNFGENKKNVFVIEKNEAGKYFFIKQGADKRNEPRKISLLFVDESFMLDKADLSDELMTEIELEETSEPMSERLLEIFDNFVAKKRKSIKKKPNIKLIVRSEKPDILEGERDEGEGEEGEE